MSSDIKIKVQSFGRFLSNMVMPNIGAFIAWGIITALFIPTGWLPNETLAKLVGPMITYLLPLLIGYTGGKLVGGERGGVVGAITTMAVIVGADMPMFLGSMMAFMFCGLTMNAVGRAAGHMVEEVRRQFREIPGILTGKAEPDYARCVAISTKGAQHEMVTPSLLAIIAPILTGLIFGVTGVVGLLIGGLSTGFVLAIFMANSGGAWDNAKKHIEEGNHGGKGSEAHKATVVGDTVGDPFKDTSGPSLNILIKLMSMVAIVMAGLTVAWSLF